MMLGDHFRRHPYPTGIEAELLNEVAASGIEWDAGKYVTVQIDKDTWEALQEMRDGGGQQP